MGTVDLTLLKTHCVQVLGMMQGEKAESPEGHGLWGDGECSPETRTKHSFCQLVVSPSPGGSFLLTQLKDVTPSSPPGQGPGCRVLSGRESQLQICAWQFRSSCASHGTPHTPQRTRAPLRPQLWNLVCPVHLDRLWGVDNTGGNQPSLNSV